MTNEIKNALAEGLKLKEASVKRAQNTNKNPRFAPVYEQELNDLLAARTWLNSQKTT